jgi:polar amino acid transport system substrate-binding protein
MGLAALASVAAAACAGERGAAGPEFEAATPGVLTVATAFLPAPGFWEGSPPSSGFEAGLARDLARRLGSNDVDVVRVPFSEILAGDLHGADLALSQLTPTEEREAAVDFTTPYLSAPPGILAPHRVDAADAEALRELRWVVPRGSTLTPIVRDRIRPAQDPIEVEDRDAALGVLRSGRADAVLLDLPVALGLARAEPGRFRVLGQLEGEQGLAAVLPEGSRNVEIVDSAIRSLQADGTIDDLTERWLGRSTSDVPLILTEE